MPTPHVSTVESVVPPWAVQQRIGTAAARYAMNTMLMPRTDSGLSYTDYRSGVMASGDGGSTHLAMRVTAGEGMTVEVAQGNCVINTPQQGAYMCCLDSTKTLEVPASSASTSRYDLVVATVFDDNNSALAGEIDVRSFAVELVQGDPSTGRPVVPDAPVGSIPLASLYIGQAAADLLGTDPNITGSRNSVVQDLRGPGLTARGGMRALYGSDTQNDAEAYQQPGAYPGDQRWVHTSGFQHQVYYGSSDDPSRGGWRGVFNCLVYNARPPRSLFDSWVKNTDNRRELCRVSVPYPGTPFMVYPTATVLAEISPRTSGEHFVAIGSVNGSTITNSRRDAGPATDDLREGWECSPIMWGPFHETTDIVLGQRVVSSPSNFGVGFRHTQPDLSLLSVLVFPSTVAPPAW